MYDVIKWLVSCLYLMFLDLFVLGVVCKGNLNVWGLIKKYDENVVIYYIFFNILVFIFECFCLW